MLIPTSFDVTSNGEVTEPAGVGENGYGENTNYQFSMSVFGNTLDFTYCGDDGSEANHEQIITAIKLYN